MGTGIMATPEMQGRRPKIIVLTILYVIADTAYHIAVYVNKTTPVSPTI
jgi:hypothetical protein